MLVQIRRAGTVVAADLVPAARHHFAERAWVRLPALLEGRLLREVLERVAAGEFVERVHGGIGPNRELCLVEGAATALLRLLFNGVALFRLVAQVADCGPIGSFEGRVYRVAPGLGHHDAWHDDVGEHRLVALSLNLGPDPYVGAALRIRDRRTGRITDEVTNTEPGDALVFRIDPALEHRITDIEGSAPKTAWAGWFKARPDFRAVLARRRAHAGSNPG